MHKASTRPKPRKGRISPAVIVEFSDLDGGVVQTGANPVPACTNRFDVYEL